MAPTPIRIRTGIDHTDLPALPRQLPAMRCRLRSPRQGCYIPQPPDVWFRRHSAPTHLQLVVGPHAARTPQRWPHLRSPIRSLASGLVPRQALSQMFGTFRDAPFPTVSSLLCRDLHASANWLPTPQLCHPSSSPQHRQAFVALIGVEESALSPDGRSAVVAAPTGPRCSAHSLLRRYTTARCRHAAERAATANVTATVARR